MARKTPWKPKGSGMKAVRVLLDLSSLGIFMVAATFVGGGIGYFLDGKLGTSPWLSLFFLLLGIAAGFLKLYETAKALGKNNREEESTPPEDS